MRPRTDIGEAALSGDDRRALDFADHFEDRFINQGDANRTLVETLDLAWELLSPYADDDLKRTHPNTIHAHREDRRTL